MINNILSSINDAFFRLESFLNGNLKEYKYFGFDSAFTKLFKEAKKLENFNYDNCKLIGEYYKLLSQLSHTLDKADFQNDFAFESKDLIKECTEIDNLSWERVGEFCEFSTQDEIDAFEKNFSINDILKKESNEPVNNSIIRNDKGKGLKLREIALLYAFQRKNINKLNCNEIASNYGHKSGAKLYHLFNQYYNRTDRKAKPNPCTKITLQNKIKLFEKVIELLSKKDRVEAEDELVILKKYKPEI